MSNDSTLTNILFRIENLFDSSNLPQKTSSLHPTNFYHISTSPDVLPNDIVVDDLDCYLNNTDHLSDSSYTSSPSIPPSSVPLIQQSSSQFEFILNALTASTGRINEETTTYLNQGQPYEIKFQANTQRSPADNLLPTTYRSTLRLCFWDKTLQSQERELIQKWLNEYHLSSLFEIDMNLTYGILSIIRSKQMPNAVEIVWDTSTTASLFIRFKCTSTDFAQKRHGGEKGIPLRIQIDTYHESDIGDVKHLHACCCKIQLFRLKGAQRKNKADQLRIDKLNSDQRRRYQTTLEYTVLQGTILSSLYTLNLLSLSHPPDDLSDVYMQSTSSTTDTLVVQKKDLDEVQTRRSSSIGHLSLSLPDMKHICSEILESERNTKVTPRSSSAEVLIWLNSNNFSSVLPQFEHYTGLDLLRLTTNDIRRICHGDDAISIRLYNQLNETIVPPLKTLYIKMTNNDIYSAIYLHTLTRRELEEKLGQLARSTPQDTCPITLELTKIKLKIDSDNVVKYSLPNEGQFLLKIFASDFVLCLINNSV